MRSYVNAFESYRLKTDTYRQTLCVVTCGHVTKMAVTPFDPPYSKTYTQTWWLYLL